MSLYESNNRQGCKDREGRYIGREQRGVITCNGARHMTRFPFLQIV